MSQVGRIIVKTAGRDAGKIGVITKVVDNNHVMIEGQTRKRKVNIKHIEYTAKKIDVTENTGSDEIAKSLVQLGYKIVQKGQKSSSKEKPKSLRAQKSSIVKEKPPKKAPQEKKTTAKPKKKAPAKKKKE
ncbi:MAG: hypothetical protein ACMXYL_05905 [Candidatus Woesearchaeota archaeon]